MFPIIEKLYIVQPGDTLDAIAKKHRLVSWRALYEAPCNADFRRKRPQPNSIFPGGQLKIPPDPLTVLENRLRSLESLHREMGLYFQQIERELDKEYGGTQKMGMAVDTAATVISILTNLAGLVQSGKKAMELTGKKLAEHNAAVLKTHIWGKVDFAAGTTGSLMTITGEEGLVWGVTKVVFISWSEMTTPSYWAQRFLGKTNEAAYTEAKNKIRRTKDDALTQLQLKIQNNRNLISQVRGEASLPLG